MVNPSEQATPLVQPPPAVLEHSLSVIPEFVDAAAERLKQGGLNGEVIERRYVADELPVRRFLEALNELDKAAALTKLTGLLRTYPMILEHPYVWGVVRNLYCLASPDEELNKYLAKLLSKLVTAWVKGMTAPIPTTPGPRAEIKNPCPSGPGTERVKVAWLDEDEQALRAYLLSKRRLLEWQGRGRNPENIKRRIVKFATDALVKSGAAEWSGAWKEYVVNELPSGERIKTVRYKLLDLDLYIERMLPPEQMGRAEQDGRAAYLSYAILGTLLRKKPETIMDRLKSYRRHQAKIARQFA